jgi:hypothetical protein
LEKAPKRLVRMDELRQAAKSEVEMRIEKERDELGTRVESRSCQAEAEQGTRVDSRACQAEKNRLRLLAAYMLRWVTLRERTARSLSNSHCVKISYILVGVCLCYYSKMTKFRQVSNKCYSGSIGIRKG